jgi:RNA polymerase sigma factor (sigma-70 family)
MRDDQLVTDLVLRASTGDKQAWDALVERYAPLVWSICCRYRLGAAQAQDAGQSVWLRLVEQLGNLRDPEALPRWLATTTRLECARVLRAAHGPQAAVLALDAVDFCDDHPEIAEQQLLAAERHVALRQAFTSLPPRCQHLITLLIHDPPVPSAQISATLGVSAGSIGSMRSHCLDQLRTAPAVAALMSTEAATTPGQQLPRAHAGSRLTRTEALPAGAPVLGPYRRGRGNGQETAALTSSVILFSTAGLQSSSA